MPDITLLPANLATLVLESCLYGILLLLFISTIYFLATRRTLAGHNQSTKHHFTSLVLLGVTSLFIVITAVSIWAHSVVTANREISHWIVFIYQAFFAFIHLASARAEDAFYAGLSQRSEIIKAGLFFSSILIGDSLVGLNHYIVIFPMFTLIGTFVTSIGIVHEFTQWEPRLRGALFYKESKPWEATGFILSLLYASPIFSAFIAFRISRVSSVKTASQSRLMSFLSILVESAALQTFWLCFNAIAQFATSDTEFIASDTFPVIIGIANLLIHARVGLGWSQDSATPKKVHPTVKHTNEDAVW
ncbi:hypothetical protein DFH09DRAFT_1090038 [Mycena vulgaris]|nr:hypothetical protein DFH09DRAFT_1090038 [Mycena vulgaris]